MSKEAVRIKSILDNNLSVDLIQTNLIPPLMYLPDGNELSIDKKQDLR
jgi:hypothetical protein